jgi:DNA-binding MarR family transcriptional regulator
MQLFIASIMYRCNDLDVKKAEARKGAGGLAFLLAQVGSQAAREFAARLERLDVAPPDAGILRVLGRSAGLSQQALAAAVGIHPSRLVAIVDRLEQRGFVERRPSSSDRRAHALHLTVRGTALLAQIGVIARQHGEALCGALNVKERAQLAGLLERIARDRGLSSGVHPGYRTLGDEPAAASRPEAGPARRRGD